MSPAAITCQPSHALQTLASGQRQRQLPSVVIVARRLLLATANGSQNSPTGAATYRPSKLTPTGHRNRRATCLGLERNRWRFSTMRIPSIWCDRRWCGFSVNSDMCDSRLFEIADALRASAGSKSNRARTQAANVRELGLAACGELAGVINEPLICLKQRHPANIAVHLLNVKSTRQPIDYLSQRAQFARRAQVIGG